MSEKQLAVFDTDSPHRDLLGLVKELETSPDLDGAAGEEDGEPLGDDLAKAEWLTVTEKAGVPGLFDICQGETRHVVRVIQKQVWVSNRRGLPYEIEDRLRRGRVPYRLGYVEPDWGYVEGRHVKPQEMSGIVEVKFTPKND